MDFKIERDRELDRRARLGITDLPDPVPHLDHVKIDMHTGQAWVAGPMTKEEAAELEMWRQKRAGWQEDLEVYQADLEVEEDERIRDIIRGEIAHVERVLSIIDRALAAVN
ncbi:hypothetical protein AAFO92_17590 [Roseovarius sp. CAU 1744]|uniref:hypothetical protein n=1 Tax=Roseovarius sp. CAU 1744 TaxID=3140368 RepID=UPI00325A9CCB